jgi:glucosylceramidase
MKQWISTTEKDVWVSKKLEATSYMSEDTLELTGETLQELEGFGGCFNELEWLALSKLSAEDRKGLMNLFFHKDDGCKFNYCRIPIGANDYAADWYSCNEHAGDYAMKHFSIERDKKYSIPFIKEAQKLRPDMKFFASPWSPPTWMKNPAVYNNGSLIMDEKTLSAYALYLEKFVLAYKDEGIFINRLHIQNEPFANQKFPSCVWSGEQFRIFIRDYLGPLFKKDKIETEIWFGTLNGPALDLNSFPFAPPPELYDTYVDTVLFDKEARNYISGIGYQWAGKASIQRTHESFPELKFMQTENECGEGKNTWAYARYVYNLIHHYFTNGSVAYTYWNMVLNEHGTSTWGWDQNSMVTIDSKSGKVSYNPEFYVMKHLSHFVSPGARLVQTKGHFKGSSLAFRNPNGEIVVTVSNFLDRERIFTFIDKDKSCTANLEPMSLNTFVLE